MRIAMLTNNYKPFVGGVPISIERLANGLRSLGHEVYIFAPRYIEEAEEAFVIRCRSRNKKLKGEITVPNIFDSIIEKEFFTLHFDVIHVHHPMLMGYTALYLGRKYHVPIVFTYHTRYEQYLHYLKPYEKLQMHAKKNQDTAFCNFEKKFLFQGSQKLVTIHNRIFTNHCNLVFAPTPSIKDYLEDNGTKTEVEIMPTGLSYEDFEYDAKKTKEIKSKYALHNQQLFCTVSRLEQEKNIEFLLEGLKLYKERNGGYFKLLIIGEGTNKTELEDQTNRLGLRDNIVFCGCIPHEELNSYYHACQLFLFASRSETQGIVLLEAMAAGLPVIALRGNGVLDVVKNGYNGFITEPNIHVWVDKMETVLNSEDMYKEMRQEALKEAKRYLASNIAKCAERHYQSILFHRELGSEYENKPT